MPLKLLNSVKKILYPNLMFLTAFLILTLFYRFLFFINIYNTHVFDFYNTLVHLTVGFRNDVVLAFICLFFFSIYNKDKKGSLLILAEIFVLIVIAFIYAVHNKMFCLLLVGFNFAIFQDCLQFYKNYNIYSSFISWVDGFILFLPVLIYLFLLRFNHKTKIILATSIAIIIGLYINNGLFCKLMLKDQRSEAIFQNPVLYLTKDVWKYYHSKYMGNKALPGQTQLNSIALVDPLFSYSFNREPLLKSNVIEGPPNILILILESVGAEYVFKKINNDIPMPFLKKLATEGVFFSNHYTTGNASHYCAFSFLTGLYANTNNKHFEMRNNLNVPCLIGWLKKDFDTRFYTPGDIDFFFPSSLIKKSFKKKYGYSFIDKTLLPEVAGFKFFMDQIKEVKSPFFITYWSSAAHFPYFEYKTRNTIRVSDKNKLNRYIQNLRLLDEEIEILFLQLQKSHLLENTLILIVGDHGEGFEQHLGSIMHGTKLYEEQIKVPLILYAPKFLKKQTINQVTSTADILPSILDMMKIPYDSSSFQGRSFFRTNLARRYIFIYGEENELAAIDMNKNKTIMDFYHDQCSRFNLNKDPAELAPLTCSGEQEKAMLAFRNYQANLLDKLNNAPNEVQLND